MKTKLNVEMAATDEMIGIACEVLPDQVTLVPELPGEVTTTGGLDCTRSSSARGEIAERRAEAPLGFVAIEHVEELLLLHGVASRRQ